MQARGTVAAGDVRVHLFMEAEDTGERPRFQDGARISSSFRELRRQEALSSKGPARSSGFPGTRIPPALPARRASVYFEIFERREDGRGSKGAHVPRLGTRASFFAAE